MKVHVFYKNERFVNDIFTEVENWAIDERSNLLKLYKKNANGTLVCRVFIRLPETLKVEIYD